MSSSRYENLKMAEPADNTRPDASLKYSGYEIEVTARHLRVGCWLIVFLMPAGVVLDYFVYPERLWFFLLLRLTCSALGLTGWALYRTRQVLQRPQNLGLFLAMLPAFFISWMIYDVGDPTSPYYAGLNLVLVSMAWCSGGKSAWVSSARSWS